MSDYINDQDNRKGNSYTYDFTVKGADTTFWSQITGTLTAVGGKGRLNADRIASYVQHLFGRFIFAVNIAAVPTASDNRIIGLRNPGAPTRGSAYFWGDSVAFKAVSYDNWGTAQTTTLTFDSDWATKEVEYIINWEPGQIMFQVNDSDGYRTLATHNTRVGDLPLALDINNAVADNMDIGYISVNAPLIAA